MMKMDADEKALLESVERGEWKSAKSGKRERAKYSRYARATSRVGGRVAVPDAHLESLAQTRRRPTQRGVILA
jgi:hypothetical protein